MKRILSVGMVLVLCLSLLVTTVAASTTPTIQVPDLSGAPGDTVSVSIVFRDNPGLISAKIGVGYDTDALQLVGYDEGDFPASGYSVGPIESIPFVVNFCDGMAPHNYAEQAFVTLHFQIKENAAAGTYPLTLTCDFEGDFYNFDWEEVSFAVDEGSITVLRSAPVSPDGPAGDRLWPTLITVTAAVLIVAASVVVCVLLRKKKAHSTPKKEDENQKTKT